MEMVSVADLDLPTIRMSTASRPMSMAISLAASYDRRFPLDVLMRRPDAMLFTRYWHGSLLTPSMTFIYDLVCDLAPETVDSIYLPRLRRAVTGSIRRSDVIALISHTVEREVNELFPDSIGRTLVIEPGASSLPARSPEQDKEALRRLDLEPGFILAVGTIEPRKNLVRLIDALRHLPTTETLVLVGNEGWATDPIVEAITSLGRRCRWMKDITDGDLGSIYRAAKAFAYPSVYEGFGLPLLEAMQAGVPIACSDIAVFREVLDGVPAHFFDPHDSTSISAALTAASAEGARTPYLSDPVTRRLSHYRWERSGGILAAALEELARR